MMVGVDGNLYALFCGTTTADEAELTMNSRLAVYLNSLLGWSGIATFDMGQSPPFVFFYLVAVIERAFVGLNDFCLACPPFFNFARTDSLVELLEICFPSKFRVVSGTLIMLPSLCSPILDLIGRFFDDTSLPSTKAQRFVFVTGAFWETLRRV